MGSSSVPSATVYPTQTTITTIGTTVRVGVFSCGFSYIPQGDNATVVAQVLNDLSGYWQTIVSATGTAVNSGVFSTEGLKSVLQIYMTTSAGTATVTVAAGNDSTVPLVVDSIAAAASTIKVYGPTTLATTIAVAPLAFRWLKISIGTAGVGNTTTTYISLK